MKPYYETDNGKLYCGNCLKILKNMDSGSIQCCITSPPYWGLRDYNVDGQLGLEKTPEEYVKKMVGIFSEVKRVLKNDGGLWLNLGDSYAGAGGMGSWVDGKAAKGMAIIKQYPRNKPIKGLKPKDLCGIPWRVAFALQADGWYLRSDIIWHKPNPMPESVTDRPTKSHEYLFLLTKNQKYYYDADAIREPCQDWGLRDRTNMRGGITAPKLKHHGLTGKPTKIKVPSGWDTKKGSHSTIHREGRSKPKYQKIEEIISRNKRSVWTVATKPYKEAHFATYPEKLIEPCVLAGTKKGDTILDPFFGAATTGVVACKYDRKFIGIELNQKYCDIAKQRIEREIQQLKMF